MNPTLVTYRAAAAELGCSPRKVRELARIGRLKLVTLGYRTKGVTRNSLENLKHAWSVNR